MRFFKNFFCMLENKALFLKNKITINQNIYDMKKINSFYYPKNKEFSMNKNESTIESKLIINVENRSVVDVLNEIHEKKSTDAQNIGVLNFANAYVPGGGYILGQIAQEESLCYASNLYQALWKQAKFYFLHWLKFSPYHSHAMIYSESVTFFRNSNHQKIKPFEVNVITSAAVNKAFIWSDKNKKTEKTMDERIEKIFLLAIEKKVDVLILGPYGCGAFRNDAEFVSKTFQKYIEKYKGYFNEIIFACYGKENYELFKKNII